MRDVSATETAIIYGLEPLWGAGFAWFLLGERWGTTGWIGAALLLGNAYCFQLKLDHTYNSPRTRRMISHCYCRWKLDSTNVRIIILHWIHGN